MRFCVGLAAAISGLWGLVAGCESTKSPKSEAPKVEAVKGPQADVIKSPSAVATDSKDGREGQPAIANVPPADPLAMQKLGEAAEAQMEEEEDFSPEAMFPDRHLPVSDFPEKAQKRIRYKLRDVARAPIALRTIIPVTNQDGSTEVFGLYEYSVYEDCVKGYATRKEGRDNCRQYLYGDGCVNVGLWRARFGAPKAGATIETSGSLAVWSMRTTNSLCTVTTDRAFVDDLDRDGKLEMALDLVTTHYVEGDRSPSEFSYLRQYYLFQGTDNELGNLEQKIDSFTSWTSGGREPELDARIEMRDVNKDGRLDLVITEVPSCAQGENAYGSDDMRAECAKTPREISVYLYEWDREAPKSDDGAWSRSPELSDAWTAQAAKLAKEQAAEEAAGEETAVPATTGAAGAAAGAAAAGEVKAEEAGSRGKDEAKKDAVDGAKGEAADGAKGEAADGAKKAAADGAKGEAVKGEAARGDAAQSAGTTEAKAAGSAEAKPGAKAAGSAEAKPGAAKPATVAPTSAPAAKIAAPAATAPAPAKTK